MLVIEALKPMHGQKQRGRLIQTRVNSRQIIFHFKTKHFHQRTSIKNDFKVRNKFVFNRYLVAAVQLIDVLGIFLQASCTFNKMFAKIIRALYYQRKAGLPCSCS